MGAAAAPALQPEFAVEHGLESWNMPAKDWLTRDKRGSEIDVLMTANVVFNSSGKVLILQRAAHDSMPGRWEIPGGAVDGDDSTILHGAARELLEESGLIAKRFTHVVAEGPNQEPGQLFSTGRNRTKTWCRFTFHVDVENVDAVKVDSNEHQDFAWVSESEIREQKSGNRALPITSEGTRLLILEAFRLRQVKVE